MNQIDQNHVSKVTRVLKEIHKIPSRLLNVLSDFGFLLGIKQVITIVFY